MAIILGLDVSLAKEIGVYEAMVVHVMDIYITESLIRGENICDEGRTWYGIKSIDDEFMLPFMSQKRFNMTMNSLANQGVVMKSRFCHGDFDRDINYYCFNDEPLWFSGNVREISLNNLRNANL